LRACVKCGQPVAATAVFCPGCGSQLPKVVQGDLEDLLGKKMWPEAWETAVVLMSDDQEVGKLHHPMPLAFYMELLPKERKQYDEALRRFLEKESSRTQELNQALAYYKLGMAYERYEMKGFKKALEAYKRATTLLPGFALAHHRRGLVFRHMKKHEKQAAESFTMAGGADPQFSLAFFGQGIVNESRGKIDEAQAALQKALAVDPLNAAAHNALGLVYAKKKQYDAARREFEKVLELFPNNPTARNNMELAMLGKGRGFRDAYKRGDETEWAKNYLEEGKRQVAQGNSEAALEYFERVLRMRPAALSAYRERGSLNLSLGKNEEAARDFAMSLFTDRRVPSGGAFKEGYLSEKYKGERRQAQSHIATYLLNELRSAHNPEAVSDLIKWTKKPMKYSFKDEINTARKLEKEDPAEANYLLGVIHALKEEYSKAIEFLSQAITTTAVPGPGPYYFRGLCLLRERSEVQEKTLVRGRDEKMAELAARAEQDFREALSKGLAGKLCPSCGHRASDPEAFCLRCGSRLLGQPA